MKPKIKALIMVALVLAVFAAAWPAATQARGLVPCGGYQDDAGLIREPPCNIVHIFALIARLTNFLIGFAGVYAVFQIVGAGFWLVTSMGNEENITKNKQAITNAVVGLVLAMMAYMFMNTVVNVLLTLENKEKKVDLSNPLCYLSWDPTKCQK